MFWCLSSRSITLISGGDGLEFATPDGVADDTQGGHQPFELKVRVVDAPIDDPLVENFLNDLADPLRR